MRLALTGTQDGMSPQQRETFKNFVKNHKFTEFRHGGCIGADTQSHHIVLAIINERGEGKIHVHPSNIPQKSVVFNHVDSFHPEPNVIVHKSKPPLERNHDIVDELTSPEDTLIVTPKTSQEVVRSGTWATFRYAMREHKDIRIIIINPDGSVMEFP